MAKLKLIDIKDFVVSHTGIIHLGEDSNFLALDPRLKTIKRNGVSRQVSDIMTRIYKVVEQKQNVNRVTLRMESQREFLHRPLKECGT